jgi:hypothetical protein
MLMGQPRQRCRLTMCVEQGSPRQLVGVWAEACDTKVAPAYASKNSSVLPNLPNVVNACCAAHRNAEAMCGLPSGVPGDERCELSPLLRHLCVF